MSFLRENRPTALIGVLAIAAIAAVHLFVTRPAMLRAEPGPSATPACAQCGTVTAVRRSAHSAPVTFVDVRMDDGSRRTLREPGARFSVGDVVEVRDNALHPRNVPEES